MTGWSSPDFLLLTAVITAAYQFVFFIFAAGLKIDKVTDFAGTTNFVLLALLTLFLKGTFSPLQIALSTLVFVWGCRLAIFLFVRILIWGEDRRFDNTRDDPIKFAAFWVFQAMWVWVVSLPVTIINASSSPLPVGPTEVTGMLLWATGFVTEALADYQKLQFKRRGPEVGSQQEGSTPWCHVGLWKWSRHPNYFGEILLWTGVFIASAPHLKGWEAIALLSPLFTASVLLFLSGVPILEISANKKFGKREDYHQYKKSTSVLVPLPPAVYQPLPQWIKTWALLDLPLYNSSTRITVDDSSSETPLNS